MLVDSSSSSNVVSIQFLRPRVHKLGRIGQGWNIQCLQFCFACFTFWQRKDISEAFKKLVSMFFFCIQLVPCLAMNTLPLWIMKIPYCFTPLLPLGSHDPNHPVAIIFNRGPQPVSHSYPAVRGSCSRVCYWESDRARCCQESLSEAGALENSKPCPLQKNRASCFQPMLGD